MGVTSTFTDLFFDLFPPPPMLANAKKTTPTNNILVTVFFITFSDMNADLNIATKVTKIIPN